MTRLAREIAVHVVTDQAPHEMLRRLSDPFWFPAFGCVLGSDWHSSGVTTTATGALKEGLKDVDHDLGLCALGGKGATSRKTPHEILDRCERLAVDPAPLLHASRMAAKVNSGALQDGYQLYHRIVADRPGCPSTGTARSQTTRRRRWRCRTGMRCCCGTWIRSACTACCARPTTARSRQ